MRSTFGSVLLTSCLLAACGGGGGNTDAGGNPDSGHAKPTDVPIDPAVAAAAEASLAASLPALEGKSSLHALAAQVAIAALKAGTHATPVSATASLLGQPEARGALQFPAPAPAFAFEVTLVNPPSPTPKFSGVVVLGSNGALVLGAGTSPGPNAFPPAVGFLVDSATQVWAATQGSEQAAQVTLNGACTGTLSPPVTSCTDADFSSTTQLAITASQPVSAGASGSKTASVPAQANGMKGVSLTVNCAQTTLCGSAVTPGPSEYFFAADDGTHGNELWVTDGTSAGTRLVKDINANGSQASNPSGFTAFNGFTYFRANDGVAGFELWRTDGTVTEMVADLSPGPSSSGPTNFTLLGNELFFVASGALWITDGGTPVRIDPAAGGPLIGIANLHAFDGGLYFAGRTVASGYELWRSDGTSGGTGLFKEFNPDAGFGFTGLSYGELNGWLYFEANAGPANSGLWKTDGIDATSLHTMAVAPGMDAGSLFNFQVARGTDGGLKVFFTGVGSGGGGALWESDGTAQGTTAVSGTATYPAVLGDTLYFGCAQASGFGLCKMVPGVGVTAVDPTNGPTDARFMAPAMGAIFFRGTASGPGTATVGTELFVSDGTASGTRLVKDIVPGSGSSGPANFTPVRSVVVFQATTPNEGTELWVSDGTDTGTVLLKDIFPGTGSGIPPAL